MKITLLSALLIVFSSAVAQQTTKNNGGRVRVEGMASMLKDGTVITFKPRNGNESYDVVVKKGRFNKDFEGIEAEVCALTLNERVKDVFLTPGVVIIKIPDSLIVNALVTGTKATEEFEQFNARMLLDKTRTDWIAYSKQSPVANSPKEMEMHNMFRKANYKRLSELAFEHIKAHPQSAINPYLLYNSFVHWGDTEDDIKKALILIPKNNFNIEYGRKMRFIRDSIFVGGSAPDFVQNSPEGKSLSLKRYRGKYVLVDFWASWCVPCRAENPNLVKVYKKFNARNFEILGVSLDKQKDDWVAAIEKDGLPWVHVSDLGGWSNSVSRKYMINSVPDNFLIDPNGKILARGLSGEELDAKLTKLLMEKGK